MHLIDAQEGQWVMILGFEGGMSLEQKLSQLGLLPGDRLRIIRHAPMGGPLLVEVDGRTIALGKGIAMRIKVQET